MGAQRSPKPSGAGSNPVAPAGVIMKVVHIKKAKYDIYIGRPSKWGNPYSHKEGTLADFKVETREEAIQKYEEWIRQQPELMASLHELEGKVLGCWCAPLLCHGDVLLKLIGEIKMKVKIGDKIYDANQEPIMLILTESDKENISSMDDVCMKYCVYPDEGYTEEEIKDFMK